MAVMTLPDALNDPTVLIREISAAVPALVGAFNQYDVLDPGRLLGKIGDVLGAGIVDQWSLVDNPSLAINRINAALAQLPT
jgi:hypothetical protein